MSPKKSVPTKLGQRRKTTATAAALCEDDALGVSVTDVTSPAKTCAVCEQAIVDGEDQALFCEGACKQWFHPYCAGVPASWFASFSVSTDPFYCYS